MAAFREKFHIPLARNTSENSEITDDREAIYFNANSLGLHWTLQPKTTRENVIAILDNWKLKEAFRRYFLYIYFIIFEIFRY